MGTSASQTMKKRNLQKDWNIAPSCRKVSALSALNIRGVPTILVQFGAPRGLTLHEDLWDHLYWSLLQQMSQNPTPAAGHVAFPSPVLCDITAMCH